MSNPKSPFSMFTDFSLPFSSSLGKEHKGGEKSDFVPTNPYRGTFLTDKGKRRGSSSFGKRKSGPESMAAQMGTKIHELVQAEYAIKGNLMGAEVPLADPQTGFTGVIDMVSKRGELIEVKSVTLVELTQLRAPRPEHKLQLLAYLERGSDKDYGYLLYVAREAPGIRKAFKVDKSGEEEEVRAAALGYMLSRTSRSQMGKALSIALEEQKSIPQLVRNYGKIAQEARALRKQLVAKQRKREFDIAYKMAHSGTSDQYALNVDGMGHSGVAQYLRRALTDFGSGYKGDKKGKRKGLAVTNFYSPFKRFRADLDSNLLFGRIEGHSLVDFDLGDESLAKARALAKEAQFEDYAIIGTKKGAWLLGPDIRPESYPWHLASKYGVDPDYIRLKQTGDSDWWMRSLPKSSYGFGTTESREYLDIREEKLSILEAQGSKARAYAKRAVESFEALAQKETVADVLEHIGTLPGKSWRREFESSDLFVEKEQPILQSNSPVKKVVSQRQFRSKWKDEEKQIKQLRRSLSRQRVPMPTRTRKQSIKDYAEATRTNLLTELGERWKRMTTSEAYKDLPDFVNIYDKRVQKPLVGSYLIGTLGERAPEWLSRQGEHLAYLADEIPREQAKRRALIATHKQSLLTSSKISSIIGEAVSATANLPSTQATQYIDQVLRKRLMDATGNDTSKVEQAIAQFNIERSQYQSLKAKSSSIMSTVRREELRKEREVRKWFQRTLEKNLAVEKNAVVPSEQLISRMLGHLRKEEIEAAVHETAFKLRPSAMYAAHKRHVLQMESTIEEKSRKLADITSKLQTTLRTDEDRNLDRAIRRAVGDDVKSIFKMDGNAMDAHDARLGVERVRKSIDLMKNMGTDQGLTEERAFERMRKHVELSRQNEFIVAHQEREVRRIDSRVARGVGGNVPLPPLPPSGRIPGAPTPPSGRSLFLDIEAMWARPERGARTSFIFQVGALSVESQMLHDQSLSLTERFQKAAAASKKTVLRSSLLDLKTAEAIAGASNLASVKHYLGDRGYGLAKEMAERSGAKSTLSFLQQEMRSYLEGVSFVDQSGARRFWGTYAKQIEGGFLDVSSTVGDFYSSERQMLERTNQLFNETVNYATKKGQRVSIHGHNVQAFDIPVLRQRSSIHGIQTMNNMDAVDVVDTLKGKTADTFKQQLKAVAGSERQILQQKIQSSGRARGFMAQEVIARSLGVVSQEHINKYSHKLATFDSWVNMGVYMGMQDVIADNTNLSRAHEVVSNFDRMAQGLSTVDTAAGKVPSDITGLLEGRANEMLEGKVVPRNAMLGEQVADATHNNMAKRISTRGFEKIDQMASRIPGDMYKVASNLSETARPHLDRLGAWFDKTFQASRLGKVRMGGKGLAALGVFSMLGGMAAGNLISSPTIDTQRSTPLVPPPRRALSGKDDQFVEMQGMSDAGFAASSRHLLTDFGSGYAGSVGSVASGFIKMLSNTNNYTRSIMTTTSKSVSHRRSTLSAHAKSVVLEPNVAHGPTSGLFPKRKDHIVEVRMPPSKSHANRQRADAHHAKMEILEMKMKMKRRLRFRSVGRVGSAPVFIGNKHRCNHTRMA